MDLGLSGKKAIITGGKRGLGFATATLLAQEGCDVAVCARGDVSEAVAALGSHGTRAFGAGIDAADADAYMDGWRKGEWTPSEGTPTEVADRVTTELEAELSEERLAALLDELGPAQEA